MQIQVCWADVNRNCFVDLAIFDDNEFGVGVERFSLSVSSIHIYFLNQ